MPREGLTGVAPATAFLRDVNLGPVPVGLLVVAGATLFFSGLFFGVEATDQAYLGSLPSFLVSATNPDWAGPILVLGLAGHAIIGLYIFGRFMAGLREPAEQREEGLASQPG